MQVLDNLINDIKQKDGTESQSIPAYKASDAHRETEKLNPGGDNVSMPDPHRDTTSHLHKDMPIYQSEQIDLNNK